MLSFPKKIHPSILKGFDIGWVRERGNVVGERDIGVGEREHWDGRERHCGGRPSVVPPNMKTNDGLNFAVHLTTYLP